MAGPQRGHCSNRDIVHADNRLYSPRYDSAGTEGKDWYHFGDSSVMCFWGMCDRQSYNAWVRATNEYINGESKYQLKGHYEEILNRAKSIQGGQSLPLPMADKFNEVTGLISEWNDLGLKPDKTILDDFKHPVRMYWEGKIRGIIAYFDRAACLYDDLDKLAIEDLKQPSLAKGAPVRQLEHVEGGYLGGHGGPSGGAKGRSPIGMAVGILALGAAGYFGFKVLTE